MGGGGSSDGTIKFAVYLELAHSRILDLEGGVAPTISLVGQINSAANQSPYVDHVGVIKLSEGFFGIKDGTLNTTWELRNFPSLWDMYGKFIAGQDVHVLWAKHYEDVVHGPEIQNAVSAHSVILQDEIDTTLIPRHNAGMRDINAVHSSAFIIGRSIIADAKVKSVNDFQAKIRIAAIQLSGQLWDRHLSWSQESIKLYAELFKLYFASRFDLEAVETEYEVKEELWNLGLFEYARAMLGALNGAPAAEGLNEPSQTQKAIGGALSGAATGAVIGSAVPGIGTLTGAVVGGILGAGLSFA